MAGNAYGWGKETADVWIVFQKVIVLWERMMAGRGKGGFENEKST